MRVILPLLAALTFPLESPAQAGPRPEILVLGTYHMANPGRDVHNMEADDVLSPKRQQEIARLIDVLKRFQPTKIAIEAAVGSQRVARDYADYLAGKYTLSRNEIDQIGYRLARELGHAAVYAVDVDGDFPYMRVVNYAKANGLEAKFKELEARTGAMVKAHGDFLRSHTVLEVLEVMNADSSVARDLAAYFAFVPFADRFEYAGPDLLAMWFQRNIRIYHHIIGLIQSPGERVLVIYGAGHLGWLRQNIANDPTVKLRTLAELVAAIPPP
jgi:hypothetical protein